MRIALINPPYTLNDLTGKTASMKAVMNIIPPLGLAYIAAVLERANHNVTIHDGQLLSSNALHQILLTEQPDIVGITATTPSFESALATAQYIKKNIPKTLVVVGGSHVTALPEETLRNACFDIGVIGEAETTFLEIVQAYEKNNLADKETIKGIVYKKNDTIVRTQERPLIQDLDNLPFPARHLLPHLSTYQPTPASYRKLPVAIIVTTRGCPYSCSFCASRKTGYRMRSAANVLAEIEEVVNKYGAREIKFFDDTFTLNRKRIMEICAGIKERNLDISWCCLTRVDCIDKELLQTMKSAGCWQVLFGIESGDDAILKRMQKSSTVAKNEAAITLAHEVGLSVRADYLFGIPEETKQQMEKTLQFAIKMNTDLAHFNKFTPYPRTEFYTQLVEEGYTFNFTKNCSQLDHSIVLYTPKGMTPEEFSNYVNHAYKKYYLRIGYLLKQVSNIRSVLDLKRYYLGFRAIIGL